jgi:hypothetical protein
MVHKPSGQFDLAGSLFGNNIKLNQRLDKITRLVDWKPFEQRLNRIYSSPSGRPSHPVLLLFKCLILEAWYNLSDYAMEETLDDCVFLDVLSNLASQKQHQITRCLADSEIS